MTVGEPWFWWHLEKVKTEISKRTKKPIIHNSTISRRLIHLKFVVEKLRATKFSKNQFKIGVIRFYITYRGTAAVAPWVQRGFNVGGLQFWPRLFSSPPFMTRFWPNCLNNMLTEMSKCVCLPEISKSTNLDSSNCVLIYRARPQVQLSSLLLAFHTNPPKLFMFTFSTSSSHPSFISLFTFSRICFIWLRIEVKKKERFRF